MKKRILKWQWHEYLQDATFSLWMGLLVLPRLFGREVSDSLNSLLFWPALIILPISLYKLGYIILFPEIECTEETLKFNKEGKFYKKRFSLSVSNIDSIAESTRKAPGVADMIDVPTFIIKTKDGKEYEYYPRAKPGKRLDKVKAYILSCSVLPQIETK
ncbi:MAG: hypothetical protein HZA15_04330 [Nitrospirae bacterium]|nr:hypothetical protein [Nitrospirota bacterium]